MSLPYSDLRPAEYIPRIYDEKLFNLLNSFTLVEVEGIRGCGKTWTCLARARSITHVDDIAIVLPMVQSQPRLALGGVRPHLIDEWTAHPPLQDEAYQAASKKGTFLLTTSLAPEKAGSYARGHASQGAHMRMRTFSLAELHASDEGISLGQLLAGVFDPFPSHVKLDRIAEYLCAGGWPRSFEPESEEAGTCVSRRISETLAYYAPMLGRKEAVMRRMLHVLALSAGEDLTHQDIARRMAGDGSKVPSRNTVCAYLQSLLRAYLIEELPGWMAPIRSASRVKTKPRFFVADPSIGSVTAGLLPEDLLGNAQLFSALFKTLVAHELLVYLEVFGGAAGDGAQLCYYADADGLSVDFVVLFGDGRWAAINAEVGDTQVPASIKRLERLKKKIAGGGQLGGPAFTAVIVATTEHPRQDETSGCYVFPITSLTA